MFRTLLCALIIVSVGLPAASLLQADNAAESNESVWVGVKAWLAGEKENDYLIGTIEKKTFDEIETGKFNRRFLKVSNLRLESIKPDEYGREQRVHVDCADEYDMGVILIRYEDVLSIELKKGDPLAKR